MGFSSTSVLAEYNPQRADDVRPCPRCLNQSGHPADRCPLRPLPTAVGHTTTVTTRPSSGETTTSVFTTQPGPGGTTTSATVTTVEGNHSWYFGGGAARTVTTQPGPGGTTTSITVNIVGGHHIWYYSAGGATVAIETPTGASETQENPNRKRRRRKRPSKAARRARLAAQQTNSQDPTPPAVKTEDTAEDMIE
ncbi:hypothetical protein CFD26_106891 [Aspergillus turcosus]|uniref:Uncharacterized protein n=1 Tax=Aspergillus turcosus TaxID=1245748 RepID=A0A421D4E5_9EURO|nr:hypothetical protein CFD26_106891 [Aspergillus turcosus]